MKTFAQPAQEARHEREAERVGDAALTRSISETAASTQSAVHGVQRKPLATSRTTGAGGVAPAAGLRDSGEALPGGVRRDFENRFGHSFSDVRIHRGTTAERSAHAFGARAYTIGNNIVFNRRAYNPHAPVGRRLLAHELTHVLQQRSGAKRIQRVPLTVEQKQEIDRWVAEDYSNSIQAAKKMYEGSKREQRKGKKRAQRLIDKINEQLPKVSGSGAAQRKAFMKKMLSILHKGGFDAWLVSHPNPDIAAHIYFVRDGNVYQSNFEAFYQRIGENGGDLTDKTLLWLEGWANSAFIQRVGAESHLKTILSENKISLKDYHAAAKEEARQKEENENNPAPPDVTFDDDSIEANPDAEKTAPAPGPKTEDTKPETRDEPGQTDDSADAENESKSDADVSEADKSDSQSENKDEQSDHAPSKEDAEKTTQQDKSARIPDSTPKSKSERQQELTEFLDELPLNESDGENDGMSLEDMAKLFEDLPPEEWAAFQEFLRTTVAEKSDSNKEKTTLNESLELFKAMTPAQRELLKMQELTESESKMSKEELKKIKLTLNEATESTGEASSTINEIRNFVREKGVEDSIVDKILPPDLIPIMDEALMLEGMLAGASTRSELVHDASRELFQAIHEVRQEMLKEMAGLTAEGALHLALAYGSAGGSTAITGVRAVAVLNRVRRIIVLINRIKQFTESVQQISEMIQTIMDFKQKASEIRGKFESYREQLDRLEELQESLDAPIDLDERRQEVIDRMLAELDGRWDELLAYFYIPDDTTPEELVEILLDIPRGVEALEAMWAYYQTPGEKRGPDHQEVLALKAFYAGQLLYPVVGPMAGMAAEAIGSYQALTFSERVERFMTGGRKRRKGAKSKADKMAAGKKTREDTKKKIRGREDLDKKDLKRNAERGVRWLKARLKEDEKYTADAGSYEGLGHWSDKWFRYAVREGVKDLNKQVKKDRGGAKAWTATATVKSKDKKKKSEEVEIPKFRVGFERPGGKDKKLKATLKLNPTDDLQVDRLSLDDFSDPIRYDSGLAKRDRAFDDWLDDHGYQIIRAGSLKHIRLRGKSHAQGFLHFTSNGRDLKKGIDPDYDNLIDKHFIGNEVRDSDDLPEGYHMYKRSSDGKEVIARKPSPSNTPMPAGMPQLGFDSDGKLERGASARAPQQLFPAGVTEPQTQEDYKHEEAVDSMFDPDGRMKSDMHDQGVKWSKGQWKKKVAADPQMNKRPRKATGNLGYTINATRGSLTAKRMPELRTSDDKGHIIAARFGGLDEVKNLVPMERHLNQRGDWHQLESEFAKLYKKPKTGVDLPLKVEVHINYAHKSTRRPSTFRVKWHSADASKMEQGNKLIRNPVR